MMGIKGFTDEAGRDDARRFFPFGALRRRCSVMTSDAKAREGWVTREVLDGGQVTVSTPEATFTVSELNEGVALDPR